MISSPPQEAEHIRGKTLTPESPKPVHYPSPSNIPILEKSMDPLFHETVGTPASFQSFSQQNQTPSAQSSTSFYPEQQNVPNYHGVGASGSVGAGAGDHAQSAGYSNGYGQNTQDTSIQNVPPQNQALASLYSETKSAPHQDNRSPYPMSYAPNPYPSAPSQAQPPQGGQFQSPPQNEGGGVNFQAILDNLPNDRNPTPSMPSQPSQIHVSSLSSLPAPSNLPPRPPMQEKPVTHPNYNPDDDIRSYHPHSQKPPSSQYRGNQLQPLNLPNTPSDSNYPPSATRQNQTPSTPGYRQRDSIDIRADDDEDARWPPEINRLYEEFLEDERKFVTDGQWDQFPMGSRLFIGNLPTEKVTKRDIFHRFYRHGKLAQISIKQAYGFVQFLDARACHRALQEEQGQTVRGRKMHLEISKPQRNTKKADAANNTRNGARRRSASPDYTRGGSMSGARGVDRYTSNAMSPRESNYRRGRDDYRPMRSPSPRGRGRRDRSRDRYDRRRSRSRSPLGRGGGRYRSPSPRGDLDDDLPLPHRHPQDVPDIQVIVVQDLPREYIGWVEDEFRKKGLRIDVLILSPRLSEAAVVRRQILEGVLAIVRLDASTLATGKINLKVFDRRGGAGKVQFEEYADLDPTTAAMLALNKKQSLQAPPILPPASYGQPYSYPPAAAPSYAAPQPPAYQYPPASNNPQISNLISSLDSNSLQQLLGAMSAQNNAAQAAQAQTAGLSPDLARLLGSMPASNSQTPVTPTAPQNPYANPPLQSYMGQPPAQKAPPGPAAGQAQNPISPGGQPDMHNIMAQLANYRPQ